MTRRHQTGAVRADDATQRGEAALQRALLAAQQRHALFPPIESADGPAPSPAVVVVGVSGGMDSICLAHALRALAAQLGLDLHLAHVDHGLRPGSADDAAFVAETARRWGVPCHILRVDVGRNPASGLYPEGLEAAARRARYVALCRIARTLTPLGQTPTLAVAHSMDDQAETVLLRLARGSGVAGLAAMRPVTLLETGEGAVRLVRPLLGIRRPALADYAAQHGLTWVDDPTNDDLTLARNRVRHAVLPALTHVNPGVVEVMARTAEVLAGEAARLAALDAALLARLVLPDAGQERGVRALLDLAGLRGLGSADQRGVLRAALAATFGQGEAAAYAAVEGIAARLAAAGEVSSGPHPLPGGVAWTLVRARPRWEAEEGDAALCLHRLDALPYAPDHPWPGPGHPGTALGVPSATRVGAWVLHVAPAGDAVGEMSAAPAVWRAELAVPAAADLRLTTPQPGLRVAPAGLRGGRKTLGDLFTDRKVTPVLRAGWPLVVDGASGAVLWVCGLATAQGGGPRTLNLWWQKA